MFAVYLKCLMKHKGKLKTPEDYFFIIFSSSLFGKFVFGARDVVHTHSNETYANMQFREMLFRI